MTKQQSADSDSIGQAGASQIVLTPEMIDVGSEALTGLWFMDDLPFALSESSARSAALTILTAALGVDSGD